MLEGRDFVSLMLKASLYTRHFIALRKRRVTSERTFCCTPGHAFDYLPRVEVRRKGAFRQHELMPEVNEIDA